MQAGIPDLFLILEGKLHGIEMKRTKGGILSASQKEWLDKLEKANIPTYVAKGCDEAVSYVENILKKI